MTFHYVRSGLSQLKDDFMCERGVAFCEGNVFSFGVSPVKKLYLTWYLRNFSHCRNTLYWLGTLILCKVLDYLFRLKSYYLNTKMNCFDISC